MEIDEVREQLQAAQVALNEATRADQRAQTLALRTGGLGAYLDGPEPRALAKAREAFTMWANFLAIGTRPPGR